MACDDQSNSKNNFHQTVAVLVPLPLQGHLNQLMHLSRLIVSHNIPVHYVCTAKHNLQAKVRVQGWNPNSISNIHFHDFQVPPFASPTPNPNDETKFPSHITPSLVAAAHLREPVAALIQSLSSTARKVIVIYDSLMTYVVQDAQHIANAESYVFHSSCAFTNFMFYLDIMEKPPQESSVFIPDVPYIEARAIDGPYLDLIDRMTGGPKNWALGPFNPLTIEKDNSKERHYSLKWLDKHEPNSVIYVSFGTLTAMTGEQIKEIAIGLEQSKQKFIWVIRDADKGDIFDEDGIRRHELPNGYEERVEGFGLVVRDWAPQLDILNHPSTGGFMSHCGWNSCIESITMGVPVAAWPMHSDQPRNSVLITHVLKIGFFVRDWAQRNELVTALDVEKAVRRLMETNEGAEMRQRARNLKDDILRSKDEDGVSSIEINSFIAHITR
ncbi:unnamed protein product [Lupinus luteus]|uniref:Glycosyltransferase n=1 Tax=Lupinus luteus TaxID=3873 RepID=A0AAV1X657_LUPLU